jgi:SAM-dependent methyltransferase
MHFCGSEDWRVLVVEHILPVALEGVELGPDALEIGPGPGFSTDVLHTMTDNLTAVEIDPGLADALRERMADLNVDVLLGDATDLPFPDNRFTGAASFHMLHHIPTKEAQDQLMAELARVLKPGGMLVAADSGYRADTVAFHEDDIYNPIEPDDFAARLAQVGFTDIAVRQHDLGWSCTARADSNQT